MITVVDTSCKCPRPKNQNLHGRIQKCIVSLQTTRPSDLSGPAGTGNGHNSQLSESLGRPATERCPVQPKRTDAVDQFVAREANGYKATGAALIGQAVLYRWD